MTNSVQLPVLRALASFVESDGALKLNTFGLVIEIYRGANGNRNTNRRIIQWNDIAGYTMHRAKMLLAEMRAELEAYDAGE